ncbi:60S ribosomal protein L21 [Tupaia chinensis]|uniref:60S ribosomal protein L21 n=1 Tax=Tupaia chinensis TaxID=246437 RepID=L9KFB7_TUPCH|nr:60S ribosomal protein L21 [Tupaia chinensis]
MNQNDEHKEKEEKHPIKTGRVYEVTQHAVGTVVGKRGKRKILGRRMNERIEHVDHPKSRDSFLKRVKENDRNKKEATEKGTWVQLKRQLLHPEKPQCENRWKGA